MVNRKISGPSVIRRFHLITGRLGPYAAAASAALVLWHAARDKPAAMVSVPAPLIYSTSAAGRPSASRRRRFSPIRRAFGRRAGRSCVHSGHCRQKRHIGRYFQAYGAG
jgi:hypothetical protein